MRVDQCIVSVEQRSVGGCIDLAFVFVRKYAAFLGQMLALFAIPSTLAVVLISYFTTDILMWSAILFLGMTPLLSAIIVAAIGPQVFGQTIDFNETASRILNRILIYLVFILLIRFVFFFCSFLIVPGLLLLPVAGHLAEILFLEECPSSKVISREFWLVGDGGYFRFLWHTVVLAFFWLILSLGCLLTIDLLCTTLFSTPVLFGRIVSSPDAADAAYVLITSDVRTAAALHLAIWLPFPIIRIAWFFSYLDQRIRAECWDLEVKYRTEAIRLGETS
ncbi:MAG: hypothetical protein AAF456_12815 [Planctomycetota bacterium]